MADERCGSCAHWDQVSAQSRWSVDIRLTPLPSEGDDDTRWRVGSAYQERTQAVESRYGRCRAVTMLDSMDTIDEPDVPIAFCRDGSDYKADLYSRDDFGCTLWEPSQHLPHNDAGTD